MNTIYLGLLELPCEVFSIFEVDAYVFYILMLFKMFN